MWVTWVRNVTSTRICDVSASAGLERAPLLVTVTTQPSFLHSIPQQQAKVTVAIGSRNWYLQFSPSASFVWHACVRLLVSSRATLCRARRTTCCRRDGAVAVLNCWTLDSVMWHPGRRTEAWTLTNAARVKDNAHRHCCAWRHGAQSYGRAGQQGCDAWSLIYRLQNSHVPLQTVSLGNWILEIETRVKLNRLLPSWLQTYQAESVQWCQWRWSSSCKWCGKTGERSSTQASSGATDNSVPLNEGSTATSMMSHHLVQPYMFESPFLFRKGQKYCAIIKTHSMSRNTL